ncbi:MAG: hypothetical protein WCZ90_19965 [Melioribacteraceae bacterium]
MKQELLKAILVILISPLYLFGQVDYSNPESVAQQFLDLYIAGEVLQASEDYATEESMTQVEVLVKQMVMNDKPLKNENCKYLVDSCSVNQLEQIADCSFSKIYSDEKKNGKGHLILKLVEEKWLVEYIYKRDKYL